MKSRLDQIEEQLRVFFEHSALLRPWEKRQHLLARRLVEAMISAVREQDGYLAIPGVYTIFLNPDDAAFWDTRPDLFDGLSKALQEAALDAGLLMMSPPVIHLEKDSGIAVNEFRIRGQVETTSSGSTDVMLALSPQEADPEPIDPRPANAFLIVEGSRTYPLRQAVINIGRRTDNHLILDDPRISRSHAQLRAIRGHYILFDLNSTGGTYVNGQRIVQQQLKPGDVISLAGYALIYGEDTPPLSGGTDSMSSTRALNSPSAPSSHD
jgi:hypothetical protein